MNRGDSDLFFQVNSELLITPNSISTKDFAQTFVNTHNGEVSTTYPRMRLRNFGETDDPNSWELVPLEADNRQPSLAAPCRYLLRTPFFTASELWKEWYRATWGYLDRYYIVDGFNGMFAPLSILVSTDRRALDFKRIVQALMHFNQLWPKIFGDDNKDSEQAEPQTCVSEPYISCHPNYWCAVPPNGRVFFYIRRESETGQRSTVWIQFVLTFVRAAVASPSLALTESYPVTLVGLNDFMNRGSPRPDGEPPLPFLL
ncbi:hypothetical protein GJ744_003774 [Endocarpon pusillum]|uniref:Uncharacterized protein n=1 Tax=Endocarpon pusillum TaxID=364733 RepID=A0A8H7ARB2_9EURO|nr:hypothetical protein GJ744_003774 [Endocarpon pusillum]